MQHGVPHCVAIAVIDLLEAVEIYGNERQIVVSRLGGLECGIEAFVEHGPIGQAGQRVVARQMRNGSLGALAFSDVIDRREPGAVADRGVGEAQRTSIMGGVNDVTAATDHVRVLLDQSGSFRLAEWGGSTLDQGEIGQLQEGHFFQGHAVGQAEQV